MAAKVIKTRPKAKLGRPAKYPWSDWLDGKWREVDPLEYDVSAEGLRTSIHAAGRRSNVKSCVTIYTTNSGTRMVAFRFNGVRDEDANQADAAG